MHVGLLLDAARSASRRAFSSRGRHISIEQVEAWMPDPRTPKHGTSSFPRKGTCKSAHECPDHEYIMYGYLISVAQPHLTCIAGGNLHQRRVFFFSGARPDDLSYYSAFCSISRGKLSRCDSSRCLLAFEAARTPLCNDADTARVRIRAHERQGWLIHWNIFPKNNPPLRPFCFFDPGFPVFRKPFPIAS
jgi:hypothetical protein